MSAITEVRAKSWSDLQDRLYEGSWNEETGRFRSNFVFRGCPDAHYGMKSDLVRLGGPCAELGGHLLRNFRKYAHREVATAGSLWNWLAVARHHGLPTRLLDWTFSPCVALHFAAADLQRAGENGVVWCLDNVATNRLLLARMRELVEEGAYVFTAEMLDRGAPTLQELAALADEDFVLFCEPPSLDGRIVNQFAFFSVMSRAEASLDEWLARHPGLARRIIIPAALKWEVRDKLDQAHINERVLFLGLDGLSAWLRRTYLPTRGR